jgi:ribosome-associated toxin RatA of RatAB toxin-antitoxin module
MVKTKGREIRCYDYVNHPYERVRDALKRDALSVFQSATKAAASRAQSVAAELHVDVGGIGVKADVKISVKEIEEKLRDAVLSPATRLLLEWEAAKMPRLFPLMKAELSIYPLTATETQLDFLGVYKPPFGVAGKAMNALAGHRVADACVHRFVSDVAGYLRQTLA